jgi:glycosyltransferase involved in cell wall biosynthesis
MRVLLFDASDRGGIATYTDRLTDALTAAAVDVRLSAPPGRERGAPVLPARAWGDEAHVGRAALYARRAREALAGGLAFHRAMRAVRPEIVHAHTRIAPRLDVRLHRAARRRGARVVLTIHDAEPLEGGERAVRKHAAVWRSADAVIVHGERAREQVLGAAPGASVHVVPVDLALGDRVDRAAARSRLGLGDEPFALAFGLIRPYKGLDLLAEAWPAAHALVPAARLFVVGAGGADVPALERLRSLPGVVVRHGFVAEDDVDPWLASANVLVLPYEKGVHSGVLQRGLVHGTPSIVSPALAEEAGRARAGVVVPLDRDAWTTALGAALGSSPLPAPPTPTGELTVRGTIAVYEEVGGSRG